LLYQIALSEMFVEQKLRKNLKILHILDISIVVAGARGIF